MGDHSLERKNSPVFFRSRYPYERIASRLPMISKKWWVEETIFLLRRRRELELYLLIRIIQALPLGLRCSCHTKRAIRRELRILDSSKLPCGD